MTTSCPFKPGDLVVYTPCAHGAAADVMSSPEQMPVRGKTYQVEAVELGRYLVLTGIHHPGGGLHWAEFAKA